MPKPAPGGDGGNGAPKVSFQAEVSWWSGRPEADYMLERRAIARLHKVPVGFLDREVKKRRGEYGAGDGDLPGRALSWPEDMPWPEAVDGSSLLDEIAAVFRHCIIMSDAAVIATALWVVFTHVINCFRIAPRLAVKSPVHRCGKTHLLSLISKLALRPKHSSNITASSIFRTIEMYQPTLLLDEGDSFIPDNEEMRGLINSGHDREGANVTRLVERKGGDYEPRDFSTWTPMAIAGIGKLPTTVEDRSVAVILKRALPGENPPELTPDVYAAMAPIRRRIVRWVRDQEKDLRTWRPAAPEALNHRARDNWRPLFSIADLAGGPWGELARDAAIKLDELNATDTESRLSMLLGDCRRYFEETGADQVRSEDLAAWLGNLDMRPWAEMRGGRPITKSQLSRLLAKVEVVSGSIRQDGSTPKGYYRKRFEEAFARYLPPLQNATPPQPAASLGSEAK